MLAAIIMEFIRVSLFTIGYAIVSIEIEDPSPNIAEMQSSDATEP
jgi:hypothetical protein